jgi:hypothetical protein
VEDFSFNAFNLAAVVVAVVETVDGAGMMEGVVIERLKYKA